MDWPSQSPDHKPTVTGLQIISSENLALRRFAQKLIFIPRLKTFRISEKADITHLLRYNCTLIYSS